MPASARLAAPIVLGVALALSGGECVAQSVPQPPCGGRPSPAYAEPGNLPAVRTWTGDELGADWTPAACTGWRPLPLRMLVAAAGRFRHQGTVENLLERFGAVSALTTIRYWSVSDQRWQNLITSASALAGPDAASRRSDFSVAEMRSGTDLYFAQHDNRSTGDVVYRLRVREVTPDRLVAETENASTVRYLLLPLAGPGDLQSLYFFERRSPDEWGYYSLARTGAGASSLTTGHEASYVNRAVALFRYLAGLPTDQGPPAAP
jgi:hypothetical protein